MYEELEGDELVSKWESTHKIHRYEGDSGVRDLEKLVGTLNDDYRDIDDFLVDNPGACDKIREWIGEWVERIPDWKERILESIQPDEPSDELKARCRMDARKVIEDFMKNYDGQVPHMDFVTEVVGEQYVSSSHFDDEGLYDWAEEICKDELNRAKLISHSDHSDRSVCEELGCQYVEDTPSLDKPGGYDS